MDRKAPLLSIIIPMYNLQEYIIQALESIYSQQVDTSLFEVIVINDGSKDNSLEIVMEYAATHSNLLVKSQENRGVSKARNAALNLAKGEYITFLDADDRFADNSLSQLFAVIQQSELIDVIYCRSFALYPSGIIESHLWKRHFSSQKIYKGNDMITAHYLNGGSVCGGIYKTDFIRTQQLFFAEDVANSEDTIFNYILYSRNPNVAFADIPLNLVTIREGSASRSGSIERALKYKNNISYLTNYSKSRVMSKKEKEIVDMAIYHSISSAINMYVRAGGKDAKYLAKILQFKEVLPLHIQRLNLNQVIKLFLLNYSYCLYFFLIRISNMLSK